MVSEDQARDLLARAGATIDVEDHAPMTLTGLPDDHRRRWPALVAIAATVSVIAGVGYGAARLSDDRPVDPGPVASSVPAEQQHVYDEDEMPSLLGYTEDEAVRELESRGLEVVIEPHHDCATPRGYVWTASPGAGTPIGAGDRVTIRVTAGPPPAARCAVGALPQAIELVRFARGLGPVPELAAPVAVAAGEDGHVELTPEQAADPTAWTVCDGEECHSPLAALAEMSTRPVALGDEPVSTWLVVTHDLGTPDDGSTCLTPDPYELGLRYHRPTYLHLGYPRDGASICPEAPVLQIDWSEDHEIASVRLRLPVADADITEPELEAGLERLAAARQFASWARGEGAAPDFADRVRHFSPGFSPRWREDPQVREGWSGCSGLGFPDCGLDPVATIARYDGRVVPAAGRSTCPAGEDVPPAFPDADVVRLSEPEPATCRDAWAVELWIDMSGEIYGVRQLGAAP